MATTFAFHYFVFSRLEPAVPSGYRIGPLLPQHKNAIFTISAYPYEAIGPSEPMSISVQETTAQVTPPGGDQFIWVTLLNTSRLTIRSYFIRVTAVVE